MEREWKSRERAINAHFMDALRAALAGARLTPTRAAPPAGIKQQTLSKWLNAGPENEYPVMSAQRFVTILEANGIAPEPVLADAVARARAAGLLDKPDMVVESGDGSVTFVEFKKHPVSDPDAKVMGTPKAAQTRNVQEEYEGGESD